MSVIKCLTFVFGLLILFICNFYVVFLIEFLYKLIRFFISQMEPGPSDSSVLYGQEIHRSQLPWSGEVGFEQTNRDSFLIE